MRFGLLLLLGAPTLPIARWMGGADDKVNPKVNAPLPDDVAKSVVPLTKFVTVNGTRCFVPASGAVIKLQATPTATYVWVLCAHHTTVPPDGGKDMKITARLGDAVLRDDAIFNTLKDGDKPVDMAVIRFKVDDPKKLPDKVTELKYGAYAKNKDLNLAKTEVIVAGCGNYATKVVVNNDLFEHHKYEVSKKDAGDYRSGWGRVSDVKETDQTVEEKEDKLKVDYHFTELVLPFEFKVGPGKDAKTDELKFGTAFVTSGDSGGPTFQKLGEDWTIVGVHSMSDAYAGEVQDGRSSYDVSVGGKDAYIQFIKDSTKPIGGPPYLPPVSARASRRLS